MPGHGGGADGVPSPGSGLHPNRRRLTWWRFLGREDRLAAYLRRGEKRVCAVSPCESQYPARLTAALGPGPGSFVVCRGPELKAADAPASPGWAAGKLKWRSQGPLPEGQGGNGPSGHTLVSGEPGDGPGRAGGLPGRWRPGDCRLSGALGRAACPQLLLCWEDNFGLPFSPAWALSLAGHSYPGEKALDLPSYVPRVWRYMEQDGGKPAEDGVGVFSLTTARGAQAPHRAGGHSSGNPQLKHLSALFPAQTTFSRDTRPAEGFFPQAV